MIRPRVFGIHLSSLATAILAMLLLASCVTPPRTVRKLIRSGKYEEAIQRGNQYLQEEPEGRWKDRVSSLIYEAEVRIALRTDTIEGYEAFEKAHPDRDDPYFHRIRDRHARLYFDEKTVPAHTVEACQEFRSLFADSQLLDASWALEYDIDWELTQEARTVEKCRQHRESYPKSPYAAQSFELEAEVVFPQARDTNSIPTWARYFKDYGETNYASNHKGQACAEIWRSTREIHRFGLYGLFGRELPICAEAALAREGQRLVAWQIALEMDTWLGWRVYRWAFGDHETAAKAMEREAALSTGPFGPPQVRNLIVEPVAAWKTGESTGTALLYAWDETGRVAQDVTLDNVVLSHEVPDTHATALGRPGMLRKLDLFFLVDSNVLNVASGADWASAVQACINDLKQGVELKLSVGLCLSGTKGLSCAGKKPSMDIEEDRLAAFLSDQKPPKDFRLNLQESLAGLAKLSFRQGSVPVIVVLSTEPDLLSIGPGQAQPSELADMVAAKGALLVLVSPPSNQSERLARASGGILWGANDVDHSIAGLRFLASLLRDSMVLSMTCDSPFDPVPIARAGTVTLRSTEQRPDGAEIPLQSLPIPAHSPLLPIASEFGWAAPAEEDVDDRVLMDLVSSPGLDGFEEAFSVVKFLARQFEERLGVRLLPPIPLSVASQTVWPQNETYVVGRGILCLQGATTTPEESLTVLGCAGAERGEFSANLTRCMEDSDLPGTTKERYSRCLAQPTLDRKLWAQALAAWSMRDVGPRLVIHGEPYAGRLRNSDLITWLCHRVSWIKQPNLCVDAQPPTGVPRPPLEVP